MPSTTTLLEAAGVTQVALALAHAAFPRYFDWRRELASLSLLTRQVFYVHTLFVALVVLLLGLLCLTSATELVATPLGQRVALGGTIFWGARLLTQFVGYSPQLWRGQRLETAVHVLFVLLWTLLSLVFGLAAIGRP